jgi:nicotinate-nucleotide adenylyltransferase
MRQLDEVIFMPERSPRQKTTATDIIHRQAMLVQALQDQEKLRSTLLDSPRFTVRETLPELKQLFPEAELTFLIGSDIARTLLYWDDLTDLLPETNFAIGLRGTDTPAHVDAIMRTLTAAHHQDVQYSVIPGISQLHTSSSAIRNGDYTQAPENVTAYIRQYGLY